AEGGPEKLAAWIQTHPLRERAGTGTELTELARLQWFANDTAGALETLRHAERTLPHADATLVDGSQIRHEFSGALVHARIHLSGGDRERALALLDRFDALADTYEKNGGRHFGLYT